MTTQDATTRDVALETLASTTQVLATMQPPHDGPLTLARVTDLVAAGDAGAIRVLGDTGRAIGRDSPMS